MLEAVSLAEGRRCIQQLPIHIGPAKIENILLWGNVTGYQLGYEYQARLKVNPVHIFHLFKI